jgi:Tol biopolymer transport system component
VLASLNHPNIAAIYGVEERALVMELVEGETLAGPLAEEMALDYARQIAGALEYAHEKGVVHRDLKPANVKVTPAGVVKLLDFGLAKAVEEERTGNPETSPTLTLRETQLGVILGTAAYMAPEQARGKTVDKRADIWAFGVVLWEMLTGKRLFEGETVSDTLAQVLTKEPDWERAPARVRRLLRACLEKDPKKRLQAIGDSMLLLEETTQAESLRHQSRVPWIAAACVATIAAMAMGFLYFRQPSERPRVLKMSVLPPEKVALPANSVPAVSPDGRQLAFAGTLDDKAGLWVRDLSSLEARLLPGTEGASLPFWSPDSRFLGFFANGKLKKTEAAGGPALTLCDAANGRGGTWNQNDVIVFAPAVLAALFRVPAAGGTPIAVTTINEQEPAHRFPWFLPDGRHFLYTAYGEGREKDMVFVADLESKSRRALIPATSNVVYAAPGYLLFLRELTLMAQPFDAGKLQTTGDAVPIAEQVGYLALDIRGLFSSSQNGVLAYGSPAVSGNSQLTWFNRSGQPTGTVGAPAADSWPAISADGSSVALTRRDPQTGLSDIWLYDLVRGTNSRFTFNTLDNQFPLWSPDNSHIAFYSTPGGNGTVYQRAASGAGRNEVLHKSTPNIAGPPTDWSRDGRYLIETVNDPRTNYDIWVLRLFGDKRPFPYLQTSASERYGKLSPNGQWLAYESDETKRNEIYVQTFPTPGGKWQVSVNSGEYPVWSRDGRELFYIGADGKMMAVEVKRGSQFEAGVPTPLFQTHLAGVGYDVSKDGRFLIPTAVEQNATVPITVVVNWTAGLKK